MSCSQRTWTNLEVAQQLHHMQEVGVIKPSNSPICVDYCPINVVTKADRFPTPRIADLFDQLEVPDSSPP